MIENPSLEKKGSAFYCGGLRKKKKKGERRRKKMTNRAYAE